MVYCIADNILSPLGATTAENYEALRAGRSALTSYASYSGRSEDDYVASRFSDEQREKLMVNGLTWFESLCYHSVTEAMSHCAIDVASPRTLLVVSTTKANIDYLSASDYATLQPAESAKRIASLLGITTPPLVVCNACISGVAAIVTAQRLLDCGSYDTAIVVGCDVISHFVVSGFQSLKAMSPEPCRPFDIERIGLNLGEAAATMILSNSLTSHLSPLTSPKGRGMCQCHPLCHGRCRFPDPISYQCPWHSHHVQRPDGVRSHCHRRTIRCPHEFAERLLWSYPWRLRNT